MIAFMVKLGVILFDFFYMQNFFLLLQLNFKTRGELFKI